MTNELEHSNSSHLTWQMVTKATTMVMADSFGSAVLNPVSGVETLSDSYPGEDPLPTQRASYEVVKRIFDILLALLLLPPAGLLMAVISSAIVLSSGGRVLFRQERIGRYGRKFTIFKFRTMRPDAESVLRDYLDCCAEAKAEWEQSHKLRNDPRVTCFGKILRETSLDEIPQILNILAGDMSFVGPRPIVTREIALYDRSYAYYLAAKPGLTGLWQVSGRSGLPYEARVMLDEEYVRGWTLAGDIWILLRTPKAVFCRSGAC